MAFQKVAKRGDLWDGELLSLEVKGERILLVNVYDHIYAYADACPHQKSRLSEGTLAGKILRCARHFWEFDACSGSGINPQNACLTAFPVAFSGEDILIDIDPCRSQGAAAQEEKEG